jgi:hypothetical protein
MILIKRNKESRANGSVDTYRSSQKSSRSLKSNGNLFHWSFMNGDSVCVIVFRCISDLPIRNRKVQYPYLNVLLFTMHERGRKSAC